MSAWVSDCCALLHALSCRRFFFRVTNTKGVPLTIRVLNADYPYDWPPNYSVRATYDREFWFQVGSPCSVLPW